MRLVIDQSHERGQPRIKSSLILRGSVVLTAGQVACQTKQLDVQVGRSRWHQQWLLPLVVRMAVRMRVAMIVPLGVVTHRGGFVRVFVPLVTRDVRMSQPGGIHPSGKHCR